MIRNAIKKALWHLGYDIRAYKYSGHPTALALELMRRTNPDLIIDVGANSGQYASEILTVRSDARIISFEALTAAHALARAQSGRYPTWTVRDRVAVGAGSGTAQINIAENSVSSSLLGMTSILLNAAPAARYIESEKVSVEPLDKLLAEDVKCGTRLYLKVDTQGYEKQVLEGASRILPHIVAMELELSFAPIYEGQALALDMISWLQSMGYRLTGLSNGLRQPMTGELLQVDAFFIRLESGAQ
jgi:FkbM family methyltransferase